MKPEPEYNSEHRLYDNFTDINYSYCQIPIFYKLPSSNFLLCYFFSLINFAITVESFITLHVKKC